MLWFLKWLNASFQSDLLFSKGTTNHTTFNSGKKWFSEYTKWGLWKKTLKKWRHKISNTLLVAIKNKLILTIADPVRKSLLGSNWQSQTVAKRRKVHSLKVWQRIFYIKIKKWTCRVILIKYPYNLRGIIWCQYPIINVRSIVKW